MNDFGLHDIDVGGFSVRNLKPGSVGTDAVNLFQLRNETAILSKTLVVRNPEPAIIPVMVALKNLKIFRIRCGLQFITGAPEIEYKVQKTSDLNTGYVDLIPTTLVDSSGVTTDVVGGNVDQVEFVTLEIESVSGDVRFAIFDFEFSYSAVPEASSVRANVILDLIVSAQGTSYRAGRSSANYGLGLSVSATKDYNYISITKTLNASVKANKEHRGRVSLSFGISDAIVIGETSKAQVSATYGLTDVSIKAEPNNKARATLWLYLSAKAESSKSARVDADGYGLITVSASADKTGRNRVSMSFGIPTVTVQADVEKSAQVRILVGARLRSPNATKS